MKRIIALTLCTALAAGLLPDLAAAQAVLAPAARGGGAVIGNVFAPAASLSIPAGLGMGFISLSPITPSLSKFSTITPAIRSAASATTLPGAFAAQPSAAPSAVGVTASAAAIVPAAVASLAPLSQEPSETMPKAAAPELAGTLKNARRLGTGTPAAAASLFDNAAWRDGRANSVKLPITDIGLRLSLGLLSAKRLLAISPSAPKHALSNDDFGGPPSLQASSSEGGLIRRTAARLGRDLGYGAKWAMTLLGISSLLQVTVKPLAEMLPWQLWLSDGMLGTFGRIELLTKFGPSDIAEAVAQSPLAFLGLTLPYTVMAEELTYRILSLGITFALLTGIRPVTSRIAKFLNDVPDLFGMRYVVQWALGKVGGVSAHAFPIASSLAAVSFATAHFAAWGVAPYTMAIHLSLGVALAWVAYRSRGVVAPFAAHLGYNLLAIGVGVAAPLFLLPQTAALVGVLAGVLSASFVYYQWRAWKKDKADALDAALGRTRELPSLWARIRRWMTIALVPLLLAASFVGLSERPTPAPTAPISITALAAMPAAAPASVVRPAAAAGPVMNAEQLVKAVKPAVVMVLTPTGSGSGFIISAEGLLVTNAHVVAGGENDNHLANSYTKVVKIRFANGREVMAQVVGFHPTKDLALIQLPPNPFGWPHVAIGDSARISEGQEIVAMGYPRGLPFSVSRGIISGKDFRSNGWVSYQQHDASVNPGNSGGPLFNMRGEVVGVNSMIITQSGGFDGISYSITSNDVQKAVDQYAKVGNISAAWLGVILQSSGGDAQFGVRIDAVRPGSPAAKAGLAAGDLLIGLDGLSVAGDPEEALSALSNSLRAKIPGDSMEVQVYRAGGVVTVTVGLSVK